MSRVIICGMSHAGLRIALLLKESGADVIAAVQNNSEFIGRLERIPVKVATGDLKDPGFLRSLDIAKAQAIIFPSEDELFNVNAALEAVEINPDARIVLRLFNLNLGQKLEKSVKNFTVLSVSQLASSGFATAALLSGPILAFESGDEILNLYTVSGASLSGKSIAEIEKGQALKVVSLNNEVFPSPDRRVETNDRLTLFSHYQDAVNLCGVHACPSTGAAQDRTDRSGTKGLFSTILQLDRVLLRTISALLALAAFCVWYFHNSERLSFLDAGYFVVTVLTTTGFGDISLKDSTALSKVVGMCLMLSGMALMAMLFAIISDMLLKKRLDLFMGRRQTKLRDHVVLCGMGDVGLRVLEDLVRIGEKVVVVEKNPDTKHIQSVRQRNIPIVISDATQAEALMNANVREAKAIICATDHDILNLEIGLNAKGLRPGIRVVLRVFEKEFAEKMEKHFGIDIALSSSSIAAPSFASAASRSGIIAFVDLHGRRLQLKEASVNGGGDVNAIFSKSEVKVLLLIRDDGTTAVNEIERFDGKGKLVYLASS